MILGWLVLGLALAVLLIAALGVYRLPDALSRQHAATKAGTWTWRLIVLVLILLAVLPLASHALARAAVAGKEPE